MQRQTISIFLSNANDKRFLISLLFIGLTVGTVFLALKQLPYLRSEFNGTHFYDLIQMMINVPYAFVAIAFVMVFQGVATSRFLQLSGSISYELYLVHFPFYGSVQGNMLYVVVFFIGTFLAAWIYKQFIVFLESNIQLKSFKAKS